MEISTYKQNIKNISNQLMFNDHDGYFFHPQNIVKKHLNNIQKHLSAFYSIIEDKALIFEVRNKAVDKKVFAYFSLFITIFLVGVGISTIIASNRHISGNIIVIYLVSLLFFFIYTRRLFSQSKSTLPIEEGLSFIQDLTKEGWVISTKTDRELYRKWAKEYKFFNQGDKDDRITIRIYGNYQGYDFCYFEYAYTIEVEVDDSYTDSNGEEVYDTSIEEEYYEHWGIFIHSSINPNFTFTNKSKKKSLKFSHLEFEKKFGLYSDKHDMDIQKLFSPKHRIKLLEKNNFFENSNKYMQKNEILAVFSKESGFYTEKLISLENFKQQKIVPYIKGVMNEPLKFIKIVKGEI